MVRSINAGHRCRAADPVKEVPQKAPGGVTAPTTALSCEAAPVRLPASRRVLCRGYGFRGARPCGGQRQTTTRAQPRLSTRIEVRRCTNPLVCTSSSYVLSGNVWGGG